MKTKDEILQPILGQLKIDELNDMQKSALRSELADKDIILLSPTGSGKTLAYLLPLLLKLDEGKTGIQALILAPSRELALQIDSVIKSMRTRWTAYCSYGGHPVAEEKKYLLNNNPAILIGTPGRIADHLRRGNITPGDITELIIDEFDKSLELGFQDEMDEIVSTLDGLKRRMLISATDMDEIPAFTGVTNPVKLNFLTPDDGERLQLLKVISPEKDKIETLFKLLCTLGNKSSIVFCNHRESVERAHKLLKEKRLYCELFHGGMEQPDRERALYKFRNGSCNILVSTDLASRGLDIPEVEHIIHYHIPVNQEAFTHRNGRTARWEARGSSYLILNETESVPEYIPDGLEEVKLPEVVTLPEKPLWVTLYIGKGKKDKLNKIDIVGFLYKKGKLAREDVGQVEVRDYYAFVAVRSNKMKQLLSLISGEKIKGMKALIEQAR